MAPHLAEDDISVRSDLSDDELYTEDPDLPDLKRNPISPKGDGGVPFTKDLLWNKRNDGAWAIIDKVMDVMRDDVEVLDKDLHELYNPESLYEDKLKLGENGMETEQGLAVYCIPVIPTESESSDGEVEAEGEEAPPAKEELRSSRKRIRETEADEEAAGAHRSKRLRVQAKEAEGEEPEYKYGRSVCPAKRWPPYQKSADYDASKAQIAVPFDRLGDAAAALLDKSNDKIVKIDGVGLEEKDLEDLTVGTAVEMERVGLSLPARFCSHSLATEKDKTLGGGRELAGLNRAWISNNVEGATPDYVKDEYGIRIREGTNPKEHLQGRGMQWVGAASADGQANLMLFLEETKKKTGGEFVEKKRTLKKDLLIQNGWPVDLGDPGKSTTDLIWDAILDQENSFNEGAWDDAFSGPPKIIDGNPYNAKKGYDEDNRRGARERQKRKLEQLRANGGWGFFNVCNEAHRGNGTSIFVYLDELGYGTEPYFQYLDFLAFHIEHEGEHSVAIVFNPLCDIFHSSTNTWDITWHSLVRQALKARTANVLQGLIWFLLDPTVEEAVVNPSFWQNFLVAFYMRVWALRNLHVHPFAATKFGLAFLDKWRNMLSKENHGLAASKYGNFNRQQRRNRRKETYLTDTRKNFEVHRYTVNCISQVRYNDAEDLEEGISNAVRMISHHNPNVNGRDEKREKLKRDELFGTLRKKFLVEGETSLHPLLKEKLVAIDNEDAATEQQTSRQSAARTVAKKQQDTADAYEKYFG